MKLLQILLAFLLFSSGLLAQKARPIIFESAFAKKRDPSEDHNHFNIYNQTVGEFAIPSGKLIACTYDNRKTALLIDKKLPTGTFPLQLAIIKDEDEEFVIYARLVFSKEKVRSWVRGSYRNTTDSAFQACLMEPVSYDEKEPYGVAVLADSLATRSLRSTEFNKKFSTIARRIKQQIVHGRTVSLGQQSFALISGASESCFYIYIGYDAKGKACRLLVDTGRLQISLSEF